MEYQKDQEPDNIDEDARSNMEAGSDMDEEG